MNKLFELSPGANLENAGVRRIRAGVPAPTTGGSLKKLSSFLLCTTFAVCPAIAAPPPLQPVNLGSAELFAVLSYAGVTNADSRNDKTVITGNLGVYPTAGTSITGFTGENADSQCCGVVEGT